MPGTRHKNPKDKADMPMCRKVDRFVGYFSNGAGYGVAVVDTDLGESLEI